VAADQVDDDPHLAIAAFQRQHPGAGFLHLLDEVEELAALAVRRAGGGALVLGLVGSLGRREAGPGTAPDRWGAGLSGVVHRHHEGRRRAREPARQPRKASRPGSSAAARKISIMDFPDAERPDWTSPWRSAKRANGSVERLRIGSLSGANKRLA